MDELREEWGGRCVMCSARESWRIGRPALPLEFAHLPGKTTPLETSRGPLGRGLPNRYHDVKKHPDCYVLLCVVCHAKLDGRGGRTEDYEAGNREDVRCEPFAEG